MYIYIYNAKVKRYLHNNLHPNELQLSHFSLLRKQQKTLSSKKCSTLYRFTLRLYSRSLY